jgi:hypothetical protein
MKITNTLNKENANSYINIIITYSTPKKAETISIQAKSFLEQVVLVTKLHKTRPLNLRHVGKKITPVRN